MLQCFFLQPSGFSRRSLRRYASGSKCPLGPYHDEMAFIETVPDRRNERGRIPAAPDFEKSDPRWPKQCRCGYVFVAVDAWQTFEEPVYRRADTGAETSLREAAPGAMWYADWYPPEWRGPDGHALIVKCPDGHDWHVDGRASNCTMPNDNVHRCWVRHGAPPLITVDKNGRTCGAGGGSILTPNFHGFLRNGIFTGC